MGWVVGRSMGVTLRDIGMVPSAAVLGFQEGMVAGAERCAWRRATSEACTELRSWLKSPMARSIPSRSMVLRTERIC